MCSLLKLGSSPGLVGSILPVNSSSALILPLFCPYSVFILRLFMYILAFTRLYPCQTHADYLPVKKRARSLCERAHSKTDLLHLVHRLFALSSLQKRLGSSKQQDQACGHVRRDTGFANGGLLSRVFDVSIAIFDGGRRDHIGRGRYPSSIRNVMAGNGWRH